MGITFTKPANGDPMTRALIKTELDRMRNYLNKGIVLADIADDSLNETHIYRPETYGFPIEGTQSIFGEMYGRHHAIDEQAGHAVEATSVQNEGVFWKERRERESIFTAHLSNAETAIVPGTSVPVVVDSPSDVDVSCQFSATNQYDASGGVFYPDIAGFFVLVYRDRTTGVALDGAGSRRDMPARWAAGGGSLRSPRRTYETGFAVSLSPGLYDIYLEYRRNAASPDITQVVASVRNIVVELERT